MVIDTRTQLIYDDINNISDILLARLKEKGYESTNDTAHGRIIFQLMWFKQEIREQRIDLPMERNEKASISYIYSNGDISNIDDSEFLLSRLMKLTNNELIIKPEHYPDFINKIKEFLLILNDPPRPLTDDESRIITELNEIIPKLETERIIPYKDFTMEAYPGLWFSCSTLRDVSSLDDIPKAGKLIREIKEGLVEGVYIDS